MKKILTDVNFVALILLIIVVISIFAIFPESKKNNNLEIIDNNQKILKESENETVKTTILQTNQDTKVINKDIYLSPRIGNIVRNNLNNQKKNENKINEKNKKNKTSIDKNENDDYIISNIKVLDQDLEEKNVFYYNSDINIIFDYSFPKGMYYFSITLGIDDTEDIEILPQRDVIRNHVGSTSENPLKFNIERDINTEHVIINNIFIKVFKVFSDELPIYVYEHPTNLTFEAKKDKDIEEQELDKNTLPDIIEAPSYEENIAPSISIIEKVKELINPVLAPSNSNNVIKDVQTGNKNHNVADNSNIINTNETECSKINKILEGIDVSDVNKNDILKLESIIPSLELCARNDKNAEKYLDFYYEQKDILNNKEIRDLNKGNSINDKILNDKSNELNPNIGVDNEQNSNMSFVDLSDINNNNNNKKMVEKSNFEKQELDRNLKLQSNKKISNNNDLLEINPLSNSIENKGRNNTIKNALIESF